MTDPQTADEWQQAVDAADFLLLLDSAIQYGLVEAVGGPPDQIDADRCLDILYRGAQRGVYPAEIKARRRSVARWLQRERSDLGLTQRELGRLAGLSQARIAYMEMEKHTTGDAVLARLRAAIEQIRKEREQ